MTKAEVEALKGQPTAAAAYLDKFDRSPYSYPSNGLKKVDGQSSEEKGCWHQQK
jgi:hypothetical protein